MSKDIHNIYKSYNNKYQPAGPAGPARSGGAPDRARRLVFLSYLLYICCIYFNIMLYICLLYVCSILHAIIVPYTVSQKNTQKYTSTRTKYINHKRKQWKHIIHIYKECDQNAQIAVIRVFGYMLYMCLPCSHTFLTCLLYLFPM